MDANRREYLVARILAGIQTIKYGHLLYYLVPPTPLQLYRANEIYQEVCNATQATKPLTSVTLKEWMLENGLWTEQNDLELQKIKKQIEDDKVTLYKTAFRTVYADKCREVLRQHRDEMTALLAKLHQFDYTTVEGLASMAKQQYLIGACLQTTSRQYVFPDESFMDADNGLINFTQETIYKNRLSETDFRDIARNEPWRQYWGANKHNVLGKSSVEMSEEQRILILWSKMYDSISENPDCPHDDVIEDDDMLDGWLIIQRREREARLIQKRGEDQISGNKKIAGAQEVFIMADTMEDARKLTSALNSTEAEVVRRQRAAALSQHGELDHFKLPDKHREVQMQAQEAFRERMRGK
jgi:hypothetical protein